MNPAFLPLSITMMNRTLALASFSAFALSALLGGCAKDAKTTPSASVSAPAVADEGYPTLQRVEYVLQCMDEHGGQNYDNMYHCVCAFDELAKRMTYQEYAESLTFTYMFDTPGERGAEFRDPPKSKVLREKLKEVKQATVACFPAKPPAPAPAAKKPEAKAKRK